MKKLILSSFSFLLLFSCQNDFNQELSSASVLKNQPPEVTSLATVSAIGTCNYLFNETNVTGSGWTKVLDEQFTSLNNWNVWTGGAYNNELQYYQGANLVLTSGNLNIVAKSQKVTGVTTPSNSTLKSFNYTSGRIESKQLYSASPSTPKVRMVARIQLPVGYGMWPAFWSYGDPWPTQGEIDILEAKGQEPSTYYTNYFYGNVVDQNLVTNSTTTVQSSVSLQTCWHVYELIWEQTKLTYLLDGQVVDVKTGGYVSSLFGKQEKIVLNLAVGGNFFRSLVTRNIVPGTMNVDYVKVFTSN